MQPLKIAILLSTFNGERWLPELLESLRSQSMPFELIWRDDGSFDQSVDLVRNFGWRQITEAPHSETGHNVGAAASFGLLMQTALGCEADLFFFADQDDLWDHTKLAKIWSEYGSVRHDIPQLFHHDLNVVDDAGKQIAPSLWSYMRLDPDQGSVNQFLTRNSVTGCATAVNRALLELATPLPESAIMHDWWLGIIGSVFGDIHSMREPLVSYRQHADNALGAKGFLHGLNPFTNWLEGWRRGNAEYRSLFSQGKALLEVMERHATVAPADLALVNEFLALPHYPLLQRCITASRLGLRDRGGILWLVAMLRVAFTRI